MNRLNYNHLHYFRTIAREGSIKEASRKLHLTQPTLSDQLKSLEEYLGTPLFERRNRQLVITELGERVLGYADRIFTIGDEMVESVLREGKKHGETVRIGVIPSLSRTFIYRLLIPVFESEDCTIKVKESDVMHLMTDLQAGDIDMILSDSQIALKPGMGIKVTNIGTSHYLAVCGKKHSKGIKNFPQSLQEIPFFNYPPDSPIRHEIDLFFAGIGIRPHSIGEADDIPFLRLITEKERCFTILPAKAVRPAIRKKKLFLLGEVKSLKTRVSLMTRENNKKVSVFKLLQSIRKAGKDDPAPSLD